MKVRVKYKTWDPRAGSAVRKTVSDEPSPATRWHAPARYEVVDPVSPRQTGKVVAIREDQAAPLADVLPIRPEVPEKKKSEELTPAELVQGLTHILNPASAFMLALGLWRIGADLGFASAFAMSEGPFAHWQTWMVIAGAMQAGVYLLRKRFTVPENQ
jgi:hypothetical protein